MVDCGGVRKILARARAPIILFTLILGASFLLCRDMARPSRNPRVSKVVDVQSEFGRLPIAFEPNQGQADGRVEFLAHGLAYALYLIHDEAILSLPGTGQRGNAASMAQMRFIGANETAELSGVNQLPGHTNYLIGKDPARWHRNIPQFSRVQYHQLYPGIDLDFYGRQGQLEYDFEVNPGADFRQIELDFGGAQELKLAPGGDLLVELDGREIRFEAPHVYQESSSGKQDVTGNFIVRGRRVAFDVGDYDRSRMLVIDPVLSFSTFLGGSGDATCTAITGAPFVAHCPAIAVDSAQRVYIAGAAKPPAGFPTAVAGAPAVIGSASAAEHVFVARINSSGTQLDLLTFLGGSGTDFPTGIGVDSGFDLYVAGTTNSPDFPTTPTAFQASATGTHVFVSKLDPTGSVNLYSTYLAGSGTDTASGLAVDSQGREYVFGSTSSADFPVTPGALQTTAAATNQFFFSKIDPTIGGANGLQYSTFIGGSTPSTGTVSGGAIAVDSNNPPNVYLAGGTTFTDMPTLNASQTEQGGADAWVAKLNAPATNTQQYTPAFETYFGGSGDDIAYGVATDGSNTYVTGSTTSSDINVPSGTSAFQPKIGGAMDAFVAKFGLPIVTGTTQGTVPLDYFTYLGGSGNDAGLEIVADAGTSTGNVRVTGFTNSGSFAPNTTLLGPGGGTDAFVARIATTTTGTSTTTTTNTSSVARLGGTGTDIGTGIAEDTGLNVYVTGDTFSSDFPTAAAAGSTPLQKFFSGTSDTFVSKLGPDVTGLNFVCNTSIPVSGPGCPSPVPSNPKVSPSPVGVGNTITFTYSIYNQGDPVAGAVFTDNVQGTNSTISGTPTTSAGTCTVASGSTNAICNLGTINPSTTTTTTSGSTTTSTTSSAVTVTVTVAATVPPQSATLSQPPPVGNSGTLSVPGTSFTPVTSPPGFATVNDFGIVPANGSTTVTVKAGETATYLLNVVPTGPIPESVALSASGLPTGASPSFAPSATVANLNNGARSITLDISTTFRVTTPASLFRRGGFTYALWLPLSGLALIGSGLSRKRKWMLVLVCTILLSGVTLQSACSSSRSNTSTTTGTPAGTYNITVNAVSGSATRTTVVQLVVQ